MSMEKETGHSYKYGIFTFESKYSQKLFAEPHPKIDWRLLIEQDQHCKFNKF